MHSHLTLGLATAIAFGSVAHAHGPDETSLEALGAGAELIFQGTVVDLAYASSVEGIPHTFVTYRVDDVLKGACAATLVLRFIGGEKLEGGVLRRLSVSHMPRFGLGEQDLLMVRGNGREECPLVGCARGRFRLVDDSVTTEEGLPVGEAPRSFVARLRDAIGRQADGMAPKDVLSADPRQPFRGPATVAAPPPTDSVAEPLARPVTAALGPQARRDGEEEEALRRNGGNPVLPEPRR